MKRPLSGEVFLWVMFDDLVVSTLEAMDMLGGRGTFARVSYSLGLLYVVNKTLKK